MELLSQHQYAARRGCSQTAVWKAIQTGRISTVKVGSKQKINPVTADREWLENTDRSKPRNTITGEPKRRRSPEEPPSPMKLDGVGGTGQLSLIPTEADQSEPEIPSTAANGNGNGSDGPTYSASRAAREAALAGIAKLQLDEKTGKLVDANEVKLAFFNATRKARDELFAIPARIAPVLAALDDAADLETILFDEIERVCKGLSDGNS